MQLPCPQWWGAKILGHLEDLAGGDDKKHPVYEILYDAHEDEFEAEAARIVFRSPRKWLPELLRGHAQVAS